MKRLLLSSLAMLVFLTGKCAVSPYEFVVWMKSGATVTFPLDDHPGFMLLGDSYMMMATGTIVFYPYEDVSKFTLRKTGTNDTPTSISHDQPSVQKPRLEGETLLFTGLSPKSKVAIYTTSGLLVDSFEASERGNADVSLQQLPADVYIIKYGNTSIKFVKK